MVRARPAKAAAPQHDPADWPFSGQDAAVADRSRQPRTQHLELVRAALLEDRAVGDQATTMADRSQQCRHGVGHDWSPAPWQISQTSAAQSRSSVLTRHQPSRARAAWGSDGATNPTDPSQRRSSSATQA
jgi:hypothetical protein